MRRLIASITGLLGLTMFAVPAAASTGSVQDAIYNGYAGFHLVAGQPEPGCTDVLPAAACDATASLTGFGQGATGWVGHASDWGGPFVEPASFGFFYAGFEYNVYEPLSSSLTDSAKWFLPAGVDAAAFTASTVAPYNAMWQQGYPVIVPNSAGAPVIPEVPAVP